MNLSCKQFRRSGISALCSAGLCLALTGSLLAAECPPAGERFVADGEETIIDTQSLLMWRRWAGQGWVPHARQAHRRLRLARQ